MSVATVQPPRTDLPAVVPEGAASGAVAAARDAQRAWAATPLAQRLRCLRRLRHAIAADPLSLAASINSPARTTAEKLASEVLPLADAIRFLEREAPRLLRTKRYGRRSRPLWLGRTRLEVRREALGVVLVVSPANYPLMLAAVQAVQALAAGNAVLLKPAPGHSGPLRRLAGMAAAAGIDPRLLVVLPEEVETVAEAAAAGVDKVFLTGSAETGRAVLATLAPHGVPSVMELSGHDAVFVCDGADLALVARGVVYGVTFNGGATCIAPRRVFVPRAMAAELERRLVESLGQGAPAVSIIAVENIDDALALNNQCPYRLGATVFGPPDEAAAVAARVDAGCVVVNDMIAPTADPRLPFGGRGRSGFGLTRGAEGLLEMTRVKAIATRIGSFRPHLEPPHAADEALFAAYLAAAHGCGVAARVRGVVSVVSNLLRRNK